MLLASSPSPLVQDSTGIEWKLKAQIILVSVRSMVSISLYDAALVMCDLALNYTKRRNQSAQTGNVRHSLCISGSLFLRPSPSTSAGNVVGLHIKVTTKS